MTGTETKITIDDIRNVAKAIAGQDGRDWNGTGESDREAYMLRAFNLMFTQEEQNQIIRGLSAA